MTVHLERPGVYPSTGHAAEGRLDQTHFHERLANDSTIKVLEDRMDELMRYWSWASGPAK